MISPLAHLNVASKLYPGAWKQVDLYRSCRGVDLPEWPEWCFMPIAAWYAIVCHGNKVNSLAHDLELAADVARLAGIGTWRYSQGVYKVDPDLFTALANSIVAGDLPSEVFYRLPEWCVYVETPGMSWFNVPMPGFWAHLERDANTSRTELRFLLETEKELVGIPLHIGAWTVTEAVDRFVHEAVKNSGMTFKSSEVDIEAISAQINPLVSVILYLCSDEPEIDDSLYPGVSPKHPSPKKTKNGWKLFPPDKPKIWNVGAEIGKQLRQATECDESGRQVKTHLRRGHWHKYWTGPRTGDQKLLFRWLHPLVVNPAGKYADE